METEKPSEPDSTTLERYVRQQFRKDEDVLCLNRKDGCFYLGTIVQVDNIYKKCLVEFLDNTKIWSSFKDLKSFAPEEPEICFFCKKPQVKDENNIIMCMCGRECQSENHEVNSSTEYYGRGLVKRSTPFPSEQPNNIVTRFRSHAVRKARRLLNNNLKRKETVSASVHRSHDKKNSRNIHYSKTFENFYKARKKKLDLGSKASTAEVKKRPQRNLLEARLNSSESKLYNPFVSVDISEIRKNKNSVQENGKKTDSSSKKPKLNKSKSVEKQKNKSKLIQKTIFDSFNVKNGDKPKTEVGSIFNKCKIKDDDLTSNDSKSNSVKSGRGRRSGGSESLDRTPNESDLVDSSDDEISSRGTLEPFIPTPKDFEGQNNPFRSVNDLMNVPTPGIPPLITLPLPLKTVICQPEPPRLKKRQLSEEDIIIDRNGQVKRRRRHRKMGTSQGLSVKPSQLGNPGKNGKKHWNIRNDKKTLQPLVNNGVDFALNGRQLRTRESLKMSEKQMSTAKSTPIKQSPKDINPLTDDLESSVKYFFGAASRILSGEKYEIRAKRVTYDAENKDRLNDRLITELVQPWLLKVFGNHLQSKLASLL